MSIVFLLFFLKKCNYFNFILLFLCPAPLLRLASAVLPLVLGLLRLSWSWACLPSVSGSVRRPLSRACVLRCSACPAPPVRTACQQLQQQHSRDLPDGDGTISGPTPITPLSILESKRPFSKIAKKQKRLH